MVGVSKEPVRPSRCSVFLADLGETQARILYDDPLVETVTECGDTMLDAEELMPGYHEKVDEDLLVNTSLNTKEKARKRKKEKARKRKRKAKQEKEKERKREKKKGKERK